MVLSRNAGLAVALAGLLAGCSELRWHRSTASQTPTDRRPLKMLAASTAGPAYAPALYIPGSANTPAAQPVNIATLAPPSAPDVETETTLPPLTPSDPAASDNPLQALAHKAAARWASLDSYACRIRRREVVAGHAKPEELLIAKFRTEPYSVYFQWLGPEAKGREVVFVQGRHGSLIHTLTASGDIVLVPGGTRFKIAPDSLLVRNRSRYPITEAGVGPLVERFGQLADALEHGDRRAGSAKYLGQLKRKEFETAVEVVVHKVPPGWEPQLPKGGQRLWCFDPENGLPVLIVTHDEADREVEYYCHDRFEFPGPYRDDEFNPDKLWSKAPARTAAQ